MFSKNNLIFLGAALIWAGDKQKFDKIIFKGEDDNIAVKDREAFRNFYADDKIDAAIKESKAIFDKVFNEDNQ